MAQRASTRRARGLLVLGGMELGLLFLRAGQARECQLLVQRTQLRDVIDRHRQERVQRLRTVCIHLTPEAA